MAVAGIKRESSFERPIGDQYIGARYRFRSFGALVSALQTWRRRTAWIEDGANDSVEGRMDGSMHGRQDSTGSYAVSSKFMLCLANSHAC